MVSAALIPAGTLVLELNAPAIPGAMIFAAIFGMGNGLLSIVTGTLPLALFGSESYGASAPFLIALAMEWLGISLSLAAIAGLGLLALGLFILLGRAPPSQCLPEEISV